MGAVAKGVGWLTGISPLFTIKVIVAAWTLGNETFKGAFENEFACCCYPYPPGYVYPVPARPTVLSRPITIMMGRHSFGPFTSISKVTVAKIMNCKGYSSRQSYGDMLAMHLLNKWTSTRISWEEAVEFINRVWLEGNLGGLHRSERIFEVVNNQRINHISQFITTYGVSGNVAYDVVG